MTGRTSPTSFLKHASDVALFYGFRPSRDIERMVRNRLEKRRGVHSFETVAAVCATCAVLQPTEPVLAFYATPSPSFLPKQFLPRETGEFGLQVVGSSGSVGEIVTLKTVAAIITEWGGTVKRVRVNALGDKDSQQRFGRELSLYARKHLGGLSDVCRQHVVHNSLSLYSCTNEACREILQNGPRPMNFLSEKSRAHFRSVLEYLENLGLPYELDDLLGGDERDPHISFAVDMEEEDGTIMGAVGGRYDDFFRRSTGRKEVAGVGASIYFRKKGAARSNFSSPQKTGRRNAPKVYFIQLGTRAKLQGLTVVDMLRQARINVSQSFDASHLSPQLSAAKDLGVSHMLIMGQREALDGTIIVRSAANSSQIIVSVSELPRFLKTLQK
jgi:histidyl-tRNA synthetase